MQGWLQREAMRAMHLNQGIKQISTIKYHLKTTLVLKNYQKTRKQEKIPKIINVLQKQLFPP